MTEGFVFLGGAHETRKGKRDMKLRKILAAAVALATGLGGLAVGVSAANGETAPTTYSIKINNPTENNTYTAYKIADFSNAEADNGSEDAAKSVMLTTVSSATSAVVAAVKAAAKGEGAIAADTEVYDAATDSLKSPYDTNPAAAVALWKYDATNTDGRMRLFADTLKSNTTDLTAVTAHKASAAEEAAKTFDYNVTGAGYYLIIDSVGDAMVAPTWIPGASGKAYKTLKGEELGVINAKPSASGTPKPSKTNDVADGTVQIGDTVNYTIKSFVPNLQGRNVSDAATYKFELVDTPTKGLTVDTAKWNLKVYIADAEIDNTNYSFELSTGNSETTFDGDGSKYFVVKLTEAGLKKYAFDASKVGKELKVTYSASVNSDTAQVKDTKGLSNKVAVNNNGTTADASNPSTTDTVYSYNFEFTKVQPDGSSLSGAKFHIYAENGTDEITGFTGTKEATSGTDGKVTFSGLKAGTYYVKETQFVDGFSSAFSPEFTVKIEPAVTGADNKPTNGAAKFTVTGLGIYSGLVSGDNVGADKTETTTTTNTNTAANVKVKNVKSITQLPLTGAYGTIVFGVIAALLAVVAALVYVRYRKLRQIANI